MNHLKSVLDEFKNFIAKGNVLDLAIGIIVGASFGKIVSSLVSDIIMPIIGLIMGKVNFTTLFIALDFNKYETLELAKKAQAPILMYGNFIQTVVDFAIVGFAIFMVVKLVNKTKEMTVKKEETLVEITTRDCDQCCSVISKKAKICPHCRSSQQ